MIENLSSFEGSGVYYGATAMEAQLCAGADVVVVGGGNSAGQAAVFLASAARRVHMLVRSDGLADTMSRYLIRRIEENPAIELRTRTQLVALEGNGSLERVHWRDEWTGRVEDRDIGHVFIMAGAVPNTGWLTDCVAVDENGFVKTGTDLLSDELARWKWPLARRPQLLENEPSRHLRGRRRARRQCQTGRVVRRRRRDRRLVCTSSAARVVMTRTPGGSRVTASTMPSRSSSVSDTRSCNARFAIGGIGQIAWFAHSTGPSPAPRRASRSRKRSLPRSPVCGSVAARSVPRGGGHFDPPLHRENGGGARHLHDHDRWKRWPPHRLDAAGLPSVVIVTQQFGAKPLLIVVPYELERELMTVRERVMRSRRSNRPTRLTLHC